MDGDGSRLSGRSPRFEGRMPRHRISRALVLHRDAVPTSTFVERGEPTSADHGVRTTRRRLPPQTTGRLHPDVTVDTLQMCREGFFIWGQSFLWKCGDVYQFSNLFNSTLGSMSLTFVG